LADARVSPDPRRAGGAGRGHAGRRAVRGRDRVCGGGCRRLPLRNASVTTAALIHVVVSGLATGSIYALMALSLVIVYNATRTLNFAQGEMLMVSTFVAWSCQRVLGLPLLAALVVAAPVASCGGGVRARRRCARALSSSVAHARVLLGVRLRVCGLPPGPTH